MKKKNIFMQRKVDRSVDYPTYDSPFRCRFFFKDSECLNINIQLFT